MSERVESVQRAFVPCSPDTERAFLGTILKDRDSRTVRRMTARGLISADDFYEHRNRRVWEAAVTLVQRGELLDPILMRRELEASDSALLDTDPGYEFWTELVEEASDSRALEEYAYIIGQTAWRRRMIVFAHDVTRGAGDNVRFSKEPLELWFNAQRQLKKLRPKPIGLGWLGFVWRWFVVNWGWRLWARFTHVFFRHHYSDGYDYW
ncbi:hypothetical protein GTO10_01780 [Candidatus Saccharibacteria bacterium]|nr:hypothetical protein [Candidatus Saccharibacteria bacterium]